ncbi:hypothetical protein BDC45DRAFT_460159 [Circinella umbellata]|nr:hypothetical protein BDC45DRAFT_460159 [Circinella umbellata]
MLSSNYFITLYFLLLLITCTAFAIPVDEQIASVAANNNNNPATDATDNANNSKTNPSPALADKNLPESEKQQNADKKDVSPSKKHETTDDTTPAEQKSPLVKIKNADDFCFFLPSEPNQEVAPTEDYGVAHCTSSDVIEGNKVFPDGFITKMHYNKTSTYVQVTGYLDSEKYGLLANDEGGQYDNHNKGKPIGAKCDGYPHFVNLVEPANQRFCIRCCEFKADCNTGRSQYGCINVIPGDYSDDELVKKVFGDVINQEEHMDSSPSLQHQVDALVELASQSTTDSKKMKAEWQMFIQQLMSTYPSEIDQLSRASQTTDWFTTVPQWWYFLTQLSVQIHNNEEE